MFHYGHMFRLLHCACSQSITAALAQMELTSAQGRVMGYLARRGEPLCAKDIEEEFHLSHPTVSGLLSRLEKKSFIEFRPDEKDGRCKRIYVLPKGEQLHETMHRTIAENEARMVENFTPEEQAQFVTLLLRAISNMGATNYIRKFKEESDE